MTERSVDAVAKVRAPAAMPGLFSIVGRNEANGSPLYSPRPRQLRLVKRMQRIHLVDSLDLVIPFEEPQHHLVGREIDQRESVLLDRLDLLRHVEMGRRHRAGAAPAG